MAIFSIVTVALWAILFAYWIFSAFTAKKTIRRASWWRGAILRLAVFMVIFMLIRLQLVDRASFSRFMFSTATNAYLGVLGLVLCAAGVAIAIWARVNLGRNWGMPMSLREGHELVTTGPYRWVRHPIYSGFLLVMLGSAFTDGAFWLVILIISAGYFIYSAKAEEKTMMEQFPDQYPAYMKRTKMLVPWVV